ncbi:hypothetical protein HDU93_005606 [Gonapodya sp. JEL0774]|nr:hypothetical protein HDU93_005606 [Gonapodya sp. JEL0774]
MWTECSYPRPYIIATSTSTTSSNGPNVGAIAGGTAAAVAAAVMVVILAWRARSTRYRSAPQKDAMPPADKEVIGPNISASEDGAAESELPAPITAFPAEPHTPDRPSPLPTSANDIPSDTVFLADSIEASTASSPASLPLSSESNSIAALLYPSASLADLPQTPKVETVAIVGGTPQVEAPVPTAIPVLSIPAIQSNVRGPHGAFVALVGPIFGASPRIELPPDTPPFQVDYEYNAVSPDEVSIRRGQFVKLKVVFRDGWAMGLNIATEQYGLLPLAGLPDELTKALRKHARNSFLESGLAIAEDFCAQNASAAAVQREVVEKKLDEIVKSIIGDIKNGDIAAVGLRILESLRRYYPRQHVVCKLALNRILVDATEEGAKHPLTQVGIFLARVRVLREIRRVQSEPQPHERAVIRFGVTLYRTQGVGFPTAQQIGLSDEDFDSKCEDIHIILLQVAMLTKLMGNGTLTAQNVHHSEAKALKLWDTLIDLAHRSGDHTVVRNNQVSVDGMHGRERGDATWTTTLGDRNGEIVHASTATGETKSGRSIRSDFRKVVYFMAEAL